MNDRAFYRGCFVQILSTAHQDHNSFRRDLMPSLTGRLEPKGGDFQLNIHYSSFLPGDVTCSLLNGPFLWQNQVFISMCSAGFF